MKKLYIVLLPCFLLSVLFLLNLSKAIYSSNIDLHSETADSKKRTILKEFFEDDEFSDRGWIDGYMNDIIKDDERGSVGMWSWHEGDKTPTNFSSMRRDLGRDYEKLFIKYYVKYNDDWIGSQKNYHPHLIAIRSNYDFCILGEYGGGANAYLTVYFDSWVNPKTNKIHPWFQLQDSKNINYDYECLQKILLTKLSIDQLVDAMGVCMNKIVAQTILVLIYPTIIGIVQENG